MTRRLSFISLSFVLSLLALTLEGVCPVTVHAAPAVSESSTSPSFTVASADPQNAVSSSASASSASSGFFTSGIPPTSGQGYLPSHVLGYGNFGPGAMSSSINLSGPPSGSSQTQNQPIFTKRAAVGTSRDGILCQYDPTTTGVVHCSDGVTYKSSTSYSQPQQPSFYASNVASGNAKQSLKKRYTPSAGFTGGSAGSGPAGVPMVPPVPARPQSYSTPSSSVWENPSFSSPVNSSPQKRSLGDSDTNDFGLGFGSAAAFSVAPSLYGSGGQGGGSDWVNYEANLGGDLNMFNGEPDLGSGWNKYSGGSGYGSSYSPSYGSSYGGSYSGSGYGSGHSDSGYGSGYSGYGESGHYSGKSPKSKRSTTTASSAPNVIPVPIDIDTLVYPDGQMTLMPSGGISGVIGSGGPGPGGIGGHAGLN
ncbi:hypothetical protein BGZ80_006483 [Entomortierella chlamydospora]|uniref:Uncharacterized protein n=1 Tax=Entomortierella chlamydospora TaxID=101097 RepID=A0A9P6N3P0_9FUNG|nr:hypothetical protein BGZ79_004483 [Entomortierella chlamydospora]KAG0024039.1 hypothetical protein BGZ80_006483 [Entomortierella chlamydospora]